MIEANHRVLVVEDEPETEVLIEKAIKALDDRIECEWMTSAEEAEKVLASGARYDLIIADHFLKGSETGLDLWRTCRRKFKDIPFILTSALNIEFFDSLVQDEKRPPLFLHKPFGITDCKGMVEWYWAETGRSAIFEGRRPKGRPFKVRYGFAVIAGLIAAAGLLKFPGQPVTPPEEVRSSPHHERPATWLEKIVARELKREIVIPQSTGGGLETPADLPPLPEKLQGLPLRNFYDFNQSAGKYPLIKRTA